jgi:curli biogenesis system outer membrane secretion channel CsgG
MNKRFCWLGILLIVGMMTASFAWGADPTERLAGNWVGDPDTALEKQGMKEQKDDPSVKMMVQMLSGMTFDFLPGEIRMEMTMMGEKQEITVPYKVVEHTDHTITIKNLGGPKEGAVSEILFLDDNHIEIVEGGNRARATYLKRAEDNADASAPAVNEPVAQETVEDLVPPPPPRFVVILPEQIDTEWYWYYYTEVSQNIVQAAVEKKLIRAGYDVIDLRTAATFRDEESIERLMQKRNAIDKATALGADYLILGSATATKMSHDVAYGVNVFRETANINARLIRVQDGQILDIAEADATAGGQAQKAAGQEALKDAGKKLAKELLSIVEEKVGEP